MRNALLAEILHPAPLVFLQLITGAFDFDQTVVALRRKIHQVRKAGAVVAQVAKNTVEYCAPVPVFDALQRGVDQFGAEILPSGFINPYFCAQRVATRSAIFALSSMPAQVWRNQ